MEFTVQQTYHINSYSKPYEADTIVFILWEKLGLWVVSNLLKDTVKHEILPLV